MSSPVNHLVLLRHAQAEHGTLRDVDRALTIDGRAHARTVGERLIAATGRPDLVLCSDAVRTRQTWQLVAGGMGEAAQGAEVHYLADLYGADLAELIDVLRAVPETASHVLVVGHEPVMSATAHHLAGPDSEEVAALRVSTGIATAMAAVLTHEAPWRELGRRSSVLTGLVSGREHG